jgi:ubiquinone/menaquinone biosynthesis C-methylase UbiE
VSRDDSRSEEESAGTRDLLDGHAGSGHAVVVSIDETAQFWDEQARTFDDEADHGLRSPAARHAWRDMLRSVLPNPPADVVDLGCGTGSLAVLLAEEGYRVTGIDLSAKMLERATAKARAAGTATSFRQGDVSDPQLQRASMDVVVVRHVTWALTDPDDAVRKWAGLLRPGGRLVLVEGLWSTGTGMTARRLEGIVRPIISNCETRPLTDEALWGRPIDDERYVLVARG